MYLIKGEDDNLYDFNGNIVIPFSELYADCKKQVENTEGRKAEIYKLTKEDVK